MTEVVNPHSPSPALAHYPYALGLGMIGLSCIALLVAGYTADRAVSLLCITFAAIIFSFFISHMLKKVKVQRTFRQKLEVTKTLLKKDFSPAFLCSPTGEVTWHNLAAHDFAKTDELGATTISTVLKDQIPNANSVIRQMVAKTADEETSQERLVGLDGRVDLHLQRLGDHQVWRIDVKPTSLIDEQHETAMLTVGRKGTILFMNEAAKLLIGERVTAIDRLFVTAAPASGKVQTLKTAKGLQRVHVQIQQLQTDRSHLFLSPVVNDIRHTNFDLKDLPIPLLNLSLAGEIEQVNDAALTLLGYSHLVGQSLSSVFEGHGILVAEWIAKARETTNSTDAEFLRVRGAKKETFVQVALKRIGDPADPRLIAILTDATKLKSLEAQFVQSQKMQAIGQLAGGVAHDFNNLLTAISGHCDLMLLRHDPGDQNYADLMQIHQNANRAAGLVSQLLAFSRKQTLQPEQLDLRNTLSDLTHLLNRLVGEKVTLTLSHDPVLRAVRADKRQLEQVIMNLVVNARDAMPDGGEITIQTESMTLVSALKRDRVTVPSGDYIVVRVSDEGIGIEDAALEKIFEPFYTTKRTGEGTGLGLSTAYGIVKQTGGFIFADSEIGQGTCFSLLFPAAEHVQVKAQTVVDTRPSKIEALCTGVVLLVEDEAPVRAFAARALKMRGFDVIEAESGEKALEVLKDDALEIDVFVTDVVMPGMDGPTWVQKAIETRPDVKVVFVSGYAEGAFQGKSSKLEKSVFLAKPYSLSDLTSTVHNQLSS